MEKVIARDVAASRVSGAATSEDAVRVAVRAAGALGVPGIFHPGLDEAGMSAIWLAMVTTIARREGVAMSGTTAAKLVSAAVAGVSAYSLGSKILSWALVLVFHMLPMATIPAAVGLNVALNALFTYKLGTTCIRRFADPNLGTAEVLEIAKHLVLVPTRSELADLRRMLGS